MADSSLPRKPAGAGPGTLGLIAVIRPGGRLISYRVLDDRPFELRAATVLYRNLAWEGFGIDGFLNRLDADLLARACEELWQLIAMRPDLVPVLARHPLSGIHAALTDVHNAHTPRKVLLVDSI